MIGGKTVLVVIQARSGSGRIKDKNIADLNGRPLMWYSIVEARKSRYADAVCVSTDAERYQRIAEAAGAEAPFLRPAGLSTSTTTSADSLRWFTLQYEERVGRTCDYIVEFMCTNPLKTAEDLDACIEKLHRSGADSVVAVARLWDQHPQRIKRIVEDELQDWDGAPETLESRRQDLEPPAYIRCGSVYALARRTLIDARNRRGAVSRPYVMPPERVVNIDEPQDLLVAAAMLQARAGEPRTLGFRVLVTASLDGLSDVLATLERIGSVDYRPTTEPGELPKLIHQYDALFVSTQLMLDAKALRRPAGSRLKVVCTASTGRDHIDLQAAEHEGIAVLSITTEFNVLKTIASTAEQAFALMLACARRIPSAFDSVKRGAWDYRPFIGVELRDKTAGIVGFGRLGTIFSKFCQAFGMRVLAYDPHVVIHDPAVIQVPELGELLRESDFVSLHVHLSPETRHLIGREQLSAMKPAAYLINTARGGVVDQDALVEALEQGTIAGAGLDVVDGEIEGKRSTAADASRRRLIEYAKTHDNLIITPHLGGMTDGGRRKGFGRAAQKLHDFLEQAPQMAQRGEASVKKPAKRVRSRPRPVVAARRSVR